MFVFVFVFVCFSFAHSVDMVCEEEAVIQKVCELYDEISSLESLKPCNHVDTLFTKLVVTCMPPTSPHFHINSLSKPLQQMRSNLISLCGQAESLLESHFSDLLAKFDSPIHHLHVFPYFSNYLKLSLLEFSILRRHCPVLPSTVAFVGSGPLPLTSIVLATRHLTSAVFHNYDLDPLANSKVIYVASFILLSFFRSFPAFEFSSGLPCFLLFNEFRFLFLKFICLFRSSQFFQLWFSFFLKKTLEILAKF